MNKTLIILIAIAVLLFGGAILLQTGNIGTTTIWKASGEGTWLLPLVLISALIDSINPCAFSILLLTIAFLLSIGKLRSNVLTIGGLYIAGIFTAYLLIGLGIVHVLHLFNTPHFMANIGAFLLIVLGMLNLINHFFPSFPIVLRVPQAAHRPIARLMEKGTAPAVFALGGLVGLCEFPCTGGPYLMIMGLLHDYTTYAKGFAYLLLYNFVFVLPLLIILSLASNKGLIGRVEQWRKSRTGRMRVWGGIAMIVLGILVFLV